MNIDIEDNTIEQIKKINSCNLDNFTIVSSCGNSHRSIECDGWVEEEYNLICIETNKHFYITTKSYTDCEPEDDKYDILNFIKNNSEDWCLIDNLYNAIVLNK